MLQYSPKIITDSLVMCLDASNNKSYPAADLPVKGGLALWLDAADDTTFSYSSGTSVSQWRDKSGNNFHASQGLVASQPSRSTFQNSRKTVNFDGTNDTVTIPNFTCNSEMSIFVVSNCGNTLFIEQTNDVNSSAAGFYIYGQGNGMFLVKRNSTNCYLSLTDWLVGGFSIASGVNSTGLDLLTYKNGSQQSASFDGRASLSNSYFTNTLYIGSRGANSLWSSGPIAEIIIYNRKVTDTERKQIHTYLGQKWGISNTDRSIVDLSGFNDNGLFGNGTVANMPDYDFYNKGALTFNGTSDYAYQSLFNNTITTTLTFDVWVKFSDTGSSGRYIMSLGRDIGVPSGGIALLAYGFSSASSGQIIFEFGSGYGRVSSGIVPTTGIWYNLTVTADGTNTRFYVNSVLANTASQTTGAVTSSPGLSIGSYLNSATPPTPGTPFFYGNIGSVKIYNKTLSQAEISQNYEAQKSKFANTIVQQGLILNIDIDNPYSYAGAGATVYDTSVTALSWTATNTTYNSSPIKYLSYNGSNSSLVSSTSTAYDSQTITMECWFYPNALAQNGFLFEKGAVNTQYSMFLNGDGNFIFRTMNTSNETVGITSSAYFIVSGWNHVVCTYNGSLKTIYVNGVQVSNLAASGALNTGQTNQYIGKYGNAADNYPFNGRIAESRVYNIALSAAQVLQNYNATRTKYGL